MKQTLPPLLFNKYMINALLAGRKIQIRKLIKPQFKKGDLILARNTEDKFDDRLDSLILKIIDVRVEFLQEISEEDAVNEGLEIFNEDGNLWYSGWMEGKDNWYEEIWKWHCNDPIQAFKELWDSINFTRGDGWATNPVVWCITYLK